MSASDHPIRHADDAVAWRRHLHMYPELQFDLPLTEAFVAERLAEFGITDVTRKVGRSGIVAVIEGKSDSGRSIGIRADMDALPIIEETDLPYRSRHEGRMHACGHDGHMAMLLAAARHLAASRNFDGRAVLIFQPAEEMGGGGRVMVEDGLFEKWPVQSVYAMHNWPGLAAGTISLCAGPMMAASGRFDLEIEGTGGHAAFPDKCIDPIWIARRILGDFDSIVARYTDPQDALVISTTKMESGSAYNVIPSAAKLGGTIRALSDVVYDRAIRRMEELALSTARLQGGAATFRHFPGYPAVVNDTDATSVVVDVARQLVGERANGSFRPTMAAEDFSYMLRQRPGAFIALGQGEGPFLHHPRYEFNDTVLPLGASLWVKLVERLLG